LMFFNVGIALNGSDVVQSIFQETISTGGRGVFFNPNVYKKGVKPVFLMEVPASADLSKSGSLAIEAGGKFTAITLQTASETASKFTTYLSERCCFVF
jgi:hypothetical protein